MVSQNNCYACARSTGTRFSHLREEEHKAVNKLRSKIRGAIVGAALGDAWGAPVEKLTHDEIKRLYGKIDSLNFEHYIKRSKTHGKGYGRVTDDTLMTLVLCDVYKELKTHLDAYAVFPLIKKIYFEEIWIPEYQKAMPLIERLFYPEKYIFLSNYLASKDPRSAGVGNMVNCGAAMYMTPVGVVNAGDPHRAYNEAIAFASSHQSSYGLEAAGVFAACVAAAFIPNITSMEIVKTAHDLAKDGTKMAIGEIISAAELVKPGDDVVKTFHEVLAKYSPVGDDLRRESENVGAPTEKYIPSRLKSIEELPIALGYIYLYGEDFYKALIEGVNSGRDTDSIGTMIGAILGCLHGVEVISKNDIETLKKANKYDFLKIADDFYSVVKDIHASDEKYFQQVKAVRDKLSIEGERHA
ncbi:MAG TPA: ADP-ribosylglycohydrolase family protein [Candidatus Marinimicrobia bacterium]|nr:ADP-ribosylglycohydrolase family protein [Candidatus Neomarinimicrobiota bacterium]